MIEQYATVLSVNGDSAVVTAERAAGCASCAAGGGCGAGVLGRLFGNRTSAIEVTAPMAVAPGDGVLIGVPEDLVLRSAMRIYVVPLALFFLGALAGHVVAGNTGGGELVTVLGGALGGFAGFASTARWSRARRDDGACRPVILQRLGAGLTPAAPVS